MKALSPRQTTESRLEKTVAFNNFAFQVVMFFSLDIVNPSHNEHIKHKKTPEILEFYQTLFFLTSIKQSCFGNMSEVKFKVKMMVLLRHFSL